MNTIEEKKDLPSTKLSRIYKTDTFGFPLYPADEEQYKKGKEETEAESDSLDLDIPGSDLEEEE